MLREVRGVAGKERAVASYDTARRDCGVFHPRGHPVNRNKLLVVASSVLGSFAI
jgi:hypothetical protein